jgi:hypothetical protein
MVKGLTIDQVGITQELRQNMSSVQERLTRIEEQLKDWFSPFSNEPSRTPHPYVLEDDLPRN